MTRTPDDVKKGLECCSVGIYENFCTDCPYSSLAMAECPTKLKTDALAYIQQLEAQNAELSGKIGQLEGILQEAKQKVRDLIVKVDKHGDDLNTTMVEFNNKIRQLEAERNDLRNGLMNATGCRECKHFNNDAGQVPDICMRCRNYSNWEWRGVQKEESQ